MSAALLASSPRRFACGLRCTVATIGVSLLNVRALNIYLSKLVISFAQSSPQLSSIRFAFSPDALKMIRTEQLDKRCALKRLTHPLRGAERGYGTLSGLSKQTGERF